jgi:hypothetical protein
MDSGFAAPSNNAQKLEKGPVAGVKEVLYH